MDWIAALTAALGAWKETVELANRRAEKAREDEKKVSDAVKALPDPTPQPKEN